MCEYVGNFAQQTAELTGGPKRILLKQPESLKTKHEQEELIWF